MGNLFGVVYEKLTVVHAFEDFNMRRRAEFYQVFHLRFGGKRFFDAMPKIDVIAGYGFQLIGINGLVTIQHGLFASPRPCFFALVEDHIEIVAAKDGFPKFRPVVASPDVDCLVVPQGIDEPFRQGQ